MSLDSMLRAAHYWKRRQDQGHELGPREQALVQRVFSNRGYRVGVVQTKPKAPADEADFMEVPIQNIRYDEHGQEDGELHSVEELRKNPSRAYVKVPIPPLPPLPPLGIDRLVSRAENTFDAFSALVPRRIADEELGDALEHIKTRVAAGASPRWVYAKIVSTIVFVALHAIWAFMTGAITKEKRKGGG